MRTLAATLMVLLGVGIADVASAQASYVYGTGNSTSDEAKTTAETTTRKGSGAELGLGAEFGGILLFEGFAKNIDFAKKITRASGTEKEVKFGDTFVGVGLRLHMNGFTLKAGRATHSYHKIIEDTEPGTEKSDDKATDRGNYFGVGLYLPFADQFDLFTDVTRYYLTDLNYRVDEWCFGVRMFLTPQKLQDRMINWPKGGSGGGGGKK